MNFKRYLVKDFDRVMTTEQIAEHLKMPVVNVRRRILRRGSPKEFYISEITERKQQSIRVDAVYCPFVTLPDGTEKQMTIPMLAAAIEGETGKVQSNRNIRNKYLRRGCPERITLEDMIQAKKISRRYPMGRPDSGKRGRKRMPPLTSADTPGILRLAAGVINDAVKLYLQAQESDAEVPRIRRKESRDAAHFLFCPEHEMRRFWIEVSGINIKITKKYLNENAQRILEEFRKQEEKEAGITTSSIAAPVIATNQPQPRRDPDHIDPSQPIWTGTEQLREPGAVSTLI
jgi:hypothetical protein